MTSNCSLYPLEPLLPEVDPAYTDGPAPFRRRSPQPADDDADTLPPWPFAQLPPRFGHFQTISIETLEEEVERAARRADR